MFIMILKGRPYKGIYFPVNCTEKMDLGKTTTFINYFMITVDKKIQDTAHSRKFLHIGHSHLYAFTLK